MFDTKYTSRSASYFTDSGVWKPGIDETRLAESAPPAPALPLAAAESRRSAESAVAPRSAASPEHPAKATTDARMIGPEMILASMSIPGRTSRISDGSGRCRSRKLLDHGSHGNC